MPYIYIFVIKSGGKGMELIEINNKYTNSLRACAHAFCLRPLSITLLLSVEACEVAQNSPYVEKKVIISLTPGYSHNSTLDCFYQLKSKNYLSQRGGSASPGTHKNKHCFNKTQYALTSEGKLVIRWFNKKYAELMGLPIPVSYKGGFPKGAKRAGKQGKMIIPEGYVKTERGISTDKFRGLL